jgi:hypothetical protein
MFNFDSWQPQNIMKEGVTIVSITPRSPHNLIENYQPLCPYSLLGNMGRPNKEGPHVAFTGRMPASSGGSFISAANIYPHGDLTTL